MFVTCRSDKTTDQIPLHADGEILAEQIPDGFKPNATATIPFHLAAHDVHNCYGGGAIILEHNVSPMMCTEFSAYGQKRVVGTSVWITDDPWPTS